MSPTYHSWANMKRRCMDPKHDRYQQYGGRGITVCESWLTFDNFLADMGEKPTGFTLERREVNGNYEPDNCEWASREKQANNRTDNRLITHDGVTLNVTQWSKRLGIPHSRLVNRLHRGWPIEKAFAL